MDNLGLFLCQSGSAAPLGRAGRDFGVALMCISLGLAAAVVLGGGLSRIERLYTRVPERWGRYVFSDSVSTRLLPPKHGDASGVRGAAWLWPGPS